MAKKKIKKWHIALVAITSTIIIAGVIFFQFTSVGYCMTIRFRDFTEVERNIFINNTYTWVAVNESDELVGKADVPALINEARFRVENLFGGELQSDPIFIISDNQNTIRRTGDRHTYTFVLHNVFTYISISYRHLNVDIIAHEMVHAELHHRVLHGKPFRHIDSFIPIWFNEGLASIVDYRNVMNKEAWLIMTDNGTNIVDVTSLTRADFQGNHTNDPFFNALIIQEHYLAAKFEVQAWLDENGLEGLLWLIERVRAGEGFYELLS